MRRAVVIAIVVGATALSGALTRAQGPAAPPGVPAVPPPSQPAFVPPGYPAPVPGPYVLGPDSQVQANVTKGTLQRDTLPPGAIYPGVPHDYQVYTPANYDASRPSPVMVFADGIRIFCGDAVRAPVVLDNLIAKRAIPSLVAIFVDPGIMPALDASTAQNRFNRTYEYDAIDGRFARFILEELLPAAAAKYKLNLSRDPGDRAIGGVSTGAVAAFVAAWERPDQFRRVLSYIGTYVDMKGANTLPFLVRKTEPRPIRVFLQDGVNDQDSRWGSWFLQNQAMDGALTFMGYDHTFVVGTDPHSSAHGGAILPDALKWLWRDYPAPVRARAPAVNPGVAPAATALDVVAADAPWQRVGAAYRSATSPAADAAGNVYFADPASNRIYRASASGTVTVFRENTDGATALEVGPDGRVYASQPSRRRIVAFAQTGAPQIVAEAVRAADLAITKAGVVYFTDVDTRRVGMIAPGSAPAVAYSRGEIQAPSAIALSPDQSMLDVIDARSKFGWSFQIASDGTLTSGEPFWRLEFSEQVDMAGIDGVAVDVLGYLYIPTVLGIEMSSQIGRVEYILNKPEPSVTITHVAFGGPQRQWLYVTTTDGRVFRRQTKRTGVFSAEPVKPPMPTL